MTMDLGDITDRTHGCAPPSHRCPLLQGCLQDAAQTADFHVVFVSSAGHRHQDTWGSIKAMDLDMAHSHTRTRSSLRSEVAEQATKISIFLAGSTGPRHEPDNDTGQGYSYVVRSQLSSQTSTQTSGTSGPLTHNGHQYHPSIQKMHHCSSQASIIAKI